MSQSVKLTDGSYIDSAGVYDTSLGMTQKAINNAVSHVGQIIFSTTLDTMEKVIAVYGGTTWSKIEGRFLIGASSSYANGSTGGEASHTLTVNEMPKHAHKVHIFTGNGTTSGSTAQYYDASGNLYTAEKGAQIPNYAWRSESFYSYGTNGVGDQAGNAWPVGSSAAHNNMPPYRAVYIWERTA